MNEIKNINLGDFRSLVHLMGAGSLIGLIKPDYLKRFGYLRRLIFTSTIYHNNLVLASVSVVLQKSQK